jgi:hypothetical protein
VVGESRDQPKQKLKTLPENPTKAKEPEGMAEVVKHLPSK